MEKKSEVFRSLSEVLNDSFPKPVTNMQELIYTRKRMAQKYGHGGDGLYRLMDLAAEGGSCPKCQTEWDYVEVKNRFADFHYFEPTCRCYPRCPRCDASLHEEFAQFGFEMKCGCRWQRKSSNLPT